MNKILAQLWKDNRSKISFSAGVLNVLAVIFYVIMWLTTPYEATETPVIVIACGLLAGAVAVVASHKNWFHVVSLSAFVLAVVTLFVMLSGRISYLAFYFSGDAMATGLSPMLVAAVICALLTVIATATAIFVEKE